jgi:hypothetical protein
MAARPTRIGWSWRANRTRRPCGSRAALGRGAGHGVAGRVGQGRVIQCHPRPVSGAPFVFDRGCQLGAAAAAGMRCVHRVVWVNRTQPSPISGDATRSGMATQAKVASSGPSCAVVEPIRTPPPCPDAATRLPSNSSQAWSTFANRNASSSRIRFRVVELAGRRRFEVAQPASEAEPHQASGYLGRDPGQ